MPKRANILVLLFLQFVCTNTFSANLDSLIFIEDVKAFAYKEIDYTITGKPFTIWTTEEKPYLYVYISQSERIITPVEASSPFIFCGTDTNKANSEELKYKMLGYHTFCYKTYANSSSKLNNRLLSYPKEAIAFIVFHELMHNYISQKKINIPYEFNEALCDAVGSYGTLAYATFTHNIDMDAVKEQMSSNEKIYKILNQTISNINKSPLKANELNSACQNKLQPILMNANPFQKDRFDYNVNNAYLVKNEYYCKHYFLLKKVFLKQKTLKAFLALFNTLPANSEQYEAYFAGRVK